MFVPLVSATCWFTLAALPDGVPPRVTLGDGAPPLRLGAKILYVNFDGGDMNDCGNDDPQGDCSTIFDGNVLPYSGDAAKRASVIQVIRSRVEDFGITVTDLRPEAGDYDMEMVGNWQGEMPGFAGIAPNIDCFDSSGGEVSFTLESSGTADGIAEIVLQEAAHTWGLEHVNEGTDLLYPTTSGSNKTFVDECHKIVSDTQLNESNGYCNQVHTEFCDSGWQNSYRELLFVFGESIADTIAPTVVITSPADGDTVESSFQLVVDIADDQSPVVVEMTITISGGALPGPVTDGGAYAGPDAVPFPIDGLPDGEYTLRVEGLDESGNPASDEITVTVQSASTDGTSTSATEPEGSSGGPVDPSGTAASADDGTTPAGTDEGGDDTSSAGGGAVSDAGCGCRATPNRFAALPLLAIAWLPRRRRTPHSSGEPQP